MSSVVNVVIPLGVVQAWCFARLVAQVMGGVVVVFQYQVDVAFMTERFPDCLGQLTQNIGFGIVENSMHGVKPQSIDAIFLKPIKGVVNKVVADGPAALTIEINRFAPGSMVVFGEKLRRIQVQIIAFGAKVVVNNVEKNHYVFGMSGIYELLEFIGPAISSGGSIGQNTVIAPISLARESRERHEFDCRGAQVRQVIQLAFGPGEGSLW